MTLDQSLDLLILTDLQMESVIAAAMAQMLKEAGGERTFKQNDLLISCRLRASVSDDGKEVTLSVVDN